MGDVAASGGYYLAAAADRVVAMPGTVTGSIGVITGKFNASDALAQVGVTHDSVEVNRATDSCVHIDWVWPMMRPPTPHLRNAFPQIALVHGLMESTQCAL